LSEPAKQLIKSIRFFHNAGFSIKPELEALEQRIDILSKRPQLRTCMKCKDVLAVAASYKTDDGDISHCKACYYEWLVMSRRAFVIQELDRLLGTVSADEEIGKEFGRIIGRVKDLVANKTSTLLPEQGQGC